MSYSLTGRKTGTVSFNRSMGTITQETLTKTSKITSNAIEIGSSIEDHVYLNPEHLQIAGVVVKDCSSCQSKLESMWKNRDLVTYVGRIRVADYVITNLQIKISPGNKNGFSFTATLQKANIVCDEYVEIGQNMLMSQQDANKSAPSQAQSVKAAGLQTTVSEKISQSAYASYVDSYNGKSSSGPTQRSSAGYNGV